jgi:membrane protein
MCDAENGRMKKKKRLKNLLAILKTALKEWWSKDPFRESAVIAFYAIFSLPGLLVVVITVAGYIFGRNEVDAEIQNQISSALGPDTADQIQSIVAKAGEAKASILASILGIFTILLGATGVFAQFQKSLNAIWEVKPKPTKSGIWYFLRVRLFSFGLIISLAFVLVISLVVSAGLSAFGDWMSARFSDAFQFFLQITNFLVSLAAISLIFALMFKFFPDVKIKWKDVWVGAIATGLLFNAGKFALGLYFGKANPGTTYGTAGSIILILLWVSYSSMIVFLGAEFTRAWATTFSGKPQPAKHAVKKVAVPS